MAIVTTRSISNYIVISHEPEAFEVVNETHPELQNFTKIYTYALKNFGQFLILLLALSFYIT